MNLKLISRVVGIVTVIAICSHCAKRELTRSEAAQLLASRNDLRNPVQSELKTTEGTSIPGGFSFDLSQDPPYFEELKRWEKADLVTLPGYRRIYLTSKGRQSVGPRVPGALSETYVVALCQESPGDVTGVASDEKTATVTFSVVHNTPTEWGAGDPRCASPSRTAQALFRRYDDGWRFERLVSAE